MHLTGGQFKGYKIKVPQNARPTLSKVRESIFNMLNQFDFKNNTFLDMFAGSGIMGLEALSRGFNVTQLEINKQAYQLIKENYSKFPLKPNLILCNSLNYKTNDKFEIIYIDPPWIENYEKIIIKANSILEDNGIIIIEYDKHNSTNTQEIIEKNKLSLKVFKSKQYGRCLIDILIKN